MSSAGSPQGDQQIHTEIWSESLKERDNLTDLGGRMIEPYTEGQGSSGF
jgi:hypothetical protein